ncbi:MAG: precorrin-6y C5,15-methyltransferase (decarboxylating) subunit CbiE [Desulfovibrionales bacterium]
MPEDKKQKVVVVGCGPGHPDYVLPVAAKAVSECEILFGAPRLLRLFPDFSGEMRKVGANIDSVVHEIGIRSRTHKVGVLVSGDPGCFSLAECVKRKLGSNVCKIIPGISSPQLALSRLGLSWTDARVFSVHGRQGPKLEAMLCERLVVILLGKDYSWIDCKWKMIPDLFYCHYCRDLGFSEEEIVQLRNIRELQELNPLNALLVLEKKDGHGSGRVI